MSKNKLCLILVLIILVAGIASITSVAYALPVDRYIEADITLSSLSIFGENTSAVVSFWESDDNKTWELSSDFKQEWCDVVYYNAEDNAVLGLTPPTAVGKYIVRVLVNDKYNQTNYFFHGKKLENKMVLSSFAYSIVYENLAVVFSPNKNVVFENGKDYFEEATNGTKVFYKGTPLTKDRDYAISLSIADNGEFKTVSSAVNPGTYKITVKLSDTYPNANIKNEEEATFESTFEIVNSVSNIVKLDSSKIYEGMYQNDLEAQSKYYNVKYNGLITTDSNLIGKYSISYLSANKVLDEAPISHGVYTIRFTFSEDIPVYDISEGDFVDLEYTIHEKPYTVKFENNATSADGYSLVYQGQPIIIKPAFKESIKTISEVKYYIADEDATGKLTYRQLSYGVYPENVGKYRAEFKIDISNGNITGSAIFGQANADYVIDENNNTLIYEFQIIPRMTVNFKSDYPTNGTTYSSIVDYNGARPQVIESIKDSTLADISKDFYKVEYFDKDWTLTDAMRSGEYHGVITFTIPKNGNVNEEGKNYWSNGDTVIVDGWKYYFDFKVQKTTTKITAVKINNGIVLNFGSNEINPNSYQVQYFRFENNINYATVNAELVNQVGTYHIVVSFLSDNLDFGFEKGEIYIIEYVNSSEGSLENIKLSLDNVTESGDGYSIKYDGNIKAVNVAFENVDASVIEKLNYTLYYEKLSRHPIGDENDWTISDYPVMPGVYRAVLIVNEPNIYFNANTGDMLTYTFTITSLQLVPTFEVKVDEYTKDLVYDNNPRGKDFNVSFTVNGRPVAIDESLYTLRYAAKENGAYSVFKSENPINAGDYVIAVYFNYREDQLLDKYGIYCDEPTITNPEDFTASNMAVRSVFSKTITIEKLSLTLLARIPVEEIAMFDLNGGEVKPQYSFFKTNGYGKFSTYEDFKALLEQNGDEALSFVGIDDFENELFWGSMNSISCDTKVEKSTANGRYISNFALNESARSNIVIDKVLYTYEGAKTNVVYSSDYYYASRKSNASFTVEYRVTPLPLIINSIALETIQENNFEEHYFGNTKPVTADELAFSTLNRKGEKYNLIDDYSNIVNNLVSYVEVRYYKRLTGETVTENSPILGETASGKLTTDLGTIEGYLFDAGDYTLRITFSGETHEEYSYFTLVNGYNEDGAPLNENEMEENSYADIRFRVLNANPLRVVFDRSGFDSFVADGNEKAFNIKFMCGNVEVTGLNYTIQKFRCVNDVEEQITGEEYPRLAGRYAIQVSFETDNFKYRIEQNGNAGESSSDAPFIVSQSYVKFYYTITNPVYLAWDFYMGGEKLDAYTALNYSFSGKAKEITVRFYDSNNPSKQVNLIPNIDYAIWYYKASTSGVNNYTKLLQAPSEPGSYVMELVFLRTLHDYKISDDAGIPYGYQDAELEDGRFGRSLVYSSNNSLYLTMFNENRYVEYQIVPQDIFIAGLSISDKVFDNNDEATLNGKYSINSLGGDEVVSSYLAIIKDLFSRGFKASFKSVSVGENSVQLYLFICSDGENEVLLPLPEQRDLDGVTAFEFFTTALNELKQTLAYGKESVKSEIDKVEAQIEEIFVCYNICFENLSGIIEKSTVIVSPMPFEREYDPFYRDNDQLTFTFENDLISKFISENLFVGALTREGRDTENKVGNYRIVRGTLALVDSLITLSDGQEVSLNDCFELKISSANVYYTITKKAITVAITDGLSKFYDEDDPEVKCEVTAGQLISGDRLLFTGEFKPLRKTLKERDDIGEYEFDMSPIRIVDSLGSDTSSNYRISFVKAVFTILAKEIVIVPIETPDAKYTDNFYELYNLNATYKRYSVKYNLNGILKDYTLTEGYALSGSFGLEEIPNTDKQISAKYKITLGSIGVVDNDGKNVSKNYIITTRGTYYYTVKKITVYLELLPENITKTYSSPDPIIPFKELSANALPKGYSLRSDSSATRKPGEDVGEYEILLNNSDKIYIVEDATGAVVTEYFYVIIRNTVSETNPKGAVFKIEPFELYVSVREATFVKGYSTIIADMIFKDKDGKYVSKSTLEKLSVSFKPLIIENPVEGINQVNIEFTDNDSNDPNFRIFTEPGFVTVIFPENNVTVKTIDNSEEIVQKNAFIFVSGMLLETKQMYLATTDNGQNPTKYITITLPVRDDLINKKLFVVAVRSDGSYEILEVEVGEGIIILSDNEFNYIMLCSLQVWPYYLVGAIVALIFFGIIAFFVTKLMRHKRRNGEKPINFKKLKKELAKGDINESNGYKPNENDSSKNELDDILGVSASNEPLSSSTKKEKTKKEEKQKEEKKPKKTKDSDPKKESITVKNETAPVSNVGSPVVPNKPKGDGASGNIVSVPTSSHDNVLNPTSSSDDLIVPVSADDSDSIIVSPSVNKIGDNSADISISDSSSNDEIVISRPRKLISDDDDI